MNRRRPVLILIAFMFVLIPLWRLTTSPAIDTMRAVDMVLLFAAGISTGAVLSGLVRARRS